MISYLARRIAETIVVLILSAIVSYSLLYIAPGGPLNIARSQQQNGRNRLTPADIERIRARYELDLDLTVRFSRWFIGYPKGPLTIGDQQFFGDTVVGCAEYERIHIRYVKDGKETDETIDGACNKPIHLTDLATRNSTRGVIFGDLGLSQVILRDRPVWTLVQTRLPYTLWLMGISTVLAILIGMALGVYSAVKPYSLFDRIATMFSFVGYSMPTSFLGILLILAFAVLPTNTHWWPFLPPGDATASRLYEIPFFGLTTFQITSGSWPDYILHFIMPCFVLVFISIAGWSRFLRASMLEALQQDFVRTARAKGVKERSVILVHTLRNALIPFITLLAGVLPGIFAGALITEGVFNWPGLGRLLLDSLERHDYTVSIGLLYVTIALQLVGYILSDICYGIADPRIKLT